VIGIRRRGIEKGEIEEAGLKGFVLGLILT
jgi:hypothetical protein